MAKARRDIDKESMYQKIMPSSMRGSDETTPTPTPEKEKKPAAPRARKAPHPVGISSRPAAPAPVTRMLETQENTAGATAAVHLAAAAPAVTAPATAAAQPAIVNIMERLIDVKLGAAMDKFRCCTCAHCRQDITAFALNKLSPRYIVQDPELIAEAMEDKEANTQVTTALVQAILKVKANPKHS